MELSKAVGAILFYQAEPMTVKRLATLLKCKEGEVRDALALLPEKLQDAGLVLMQNGDEVTLGTAPLASTLIENITKEELSKDLSKASLETLAIVLYQGPITRAEIDYVRGVNSTFILRNLLIRGLVEKIDNPKDQRSFLYKPTLQVLEYMGVSTIEDLPEYHNAIAQLGSFVAAKSVEESAAKEGTSEASRDEETTEMSQEADAMELTDEELIEEADIAEEDEAGGGFDDEALRTHTEEDRPETMI